MTLCDSWWLFVTLGYWCLLLCRFRTLITLVLRRLEIVSRMNGRTNEHTDNAVSRVASRLKITHRDKCWKIRKEWLPYPEKKKNKLGMKIQDNIKRQFLQSMSVTSEGREKCIMCYQRPKNVSLVHGKIGHQVS